MQHIDPIHTGAAAEKNLPGTRPHDLLWVADPAALHADHPLPEWATSDWLAHAPVVVRRENVDDPRFLPVGLRGKTRNERCKAYLERHAVARCVTPEMLAAQTISDAEQTIPALAALAALAPRLDALALRWGPTGSVGFALASGLPVLRIESDLDLVVRTSTPLTAAQTEALLAIRACPICPIDIQIETGHGAFSLAEWANGHRQVLLKTDAGPVLTDDPWCLRGLPLQQD